MDLFLHFKVFPPHGISTKVLAKSWYTVACSDPDNIEDNLENVKMVWYVYNDNVGVVSVCGKDEFRVDDIEYDGYLVINDLVIKDVVN